MSKTLKVLQRAILQYKLDDGTLFPVGEIRKELTDKPDIAYAFDLSEAKMKELQEILGESVVTLLPGFDTDYGYYKRYHFIPFFISMRVPDSRRQDINEIIKRYDMKRYDPFTFLLRNKGYSKDNWRVEEIDVND